MVDMVDGETEWTRRNKQDEASRGERCVGSGDAEEGGGGGCVVLYCCSLC